MGKTIIYVEHKARIFPSGDGLYIQELEDGTFAATKINFIADQKEQVIFAKEGEAILWLVYEYGDPQVVAYQWSKFEEAMYILETRQRQLEAYSNFGADYSKTTTIKGWEVEKISFDH